MFLRFDNRYCGNECRTTNVTVLKSYLWACLQSNRSAFPFRVLEITSAENSKCYAWLLRFTYFRIVVSCHPATGSLRYCKQRNLIPWQPITKKCSHCKWNHKVCFFAISESRFLKIPWSPRLCYGERLLLLSRDLLSKVR